MLVASNGKFSSAHDGKFSSVSNRKFSFVARAHSLSNPKPAGTVAYKNLTQIKAKTAVEEVEDQKTAAEVEDARLSQPSPPWSCMPCCPTAPGDLAASFKVSPGIKLDVSILAHTQWVWQGQTFEVTPEKLGLISPLGSTGQGPAILIPDPF